MCRQTAAYLHLQRHHLILEPATALFTVFSLVLVSTNSPLLEDSATNGIRSLL